MQTLHPLLQLCVRRLYGTLGSAGEMGGNPRCGCLLGDSGLADIRRAGPQRTPAPSPRRVVGRPFRDLALPARALVGLAGATSIAQGQFAL